MGCCIFGLCGYHCSLITQDLTTNQHIKLERRGQTGKSRLTRLGPLGGAGGAGSRSYNPLQDIRPPRPQIKESESTSQPLLDQAVRGGDVNDQVYKKETGLDARRSSGGPGHVVVHIQDEAEGEEATDSTAGQKKTGPTSVSKAATGSVAKEGGESSGGTNSGKEVNDAVFEVKVKQSDLVEERLRLARQARMSSTGIWWHNLKALYKRPMPPSQITQIKYWHRRPRGPAW